MYPDRNTLHANPEEILKQNFQKKDGCDSRGMVGELYQKIAGVKSKDDVCDKLRWEKLISEEQFEELLKQKNVRDFIFVVEV
jgi:hypothetical protein